MDPRIRKDDNAVIQLSEIPLSSILDIQHYPKFLATNLLVLRRSGSFCASKKTRFKLKVSIAFVVI
jgi:hypothetical protein